MQDCRSIVSIVSAHKLCFVDNGISFKYTTQPKSSLKAWPKQYLEDVFRSETQTYTKTIATNLALSHSCHILRHWWPSAAGEILPLGKYILAGLIAVRDVSHFFHSQISFLLDPGYFKHINPNLYALELYRYNKLDIALKALFYKGQ